MMNETLGEKTVTISANEYDQLCKSARAAEVYKEKCHSLNMENKSLLAELIRLRKNSEADNDNGLMMISDGLDFILNETELILDGRSRDKEWNGEHHSADEETELMLSSMRLLPANDLAEGKKHYLFIRNDYSEEEKICLSCGKKMKVNTEYPVTLFRKTGLIAELTDEIYLGYKCHECGAELKNLYDSIRHKKPVIKERIVSAETIADIVNEKFEEKNSFLKQEINWRDMELHISDHTMAEWIKEVSDVYFGGLYSKLKNELLKSEIIYADRYMINMYEIENSVVKLNKSKPLFLWIYRTSSTNKKRIILFEVTENNHPDNASRFLESYEGIVQTGNPDVFEKASDNIRIAALWENVRKLFEDASEHHDESGDMYPYAEKCLELCKKLCECEESFAGSGTDFKLELRRSKCMPVIKEIQSLVDEFFSRSDTSRYSEKTCKAFEFLYAHERELMEYLEHPEIDIDNSWCDNLASGFNDTDEGLKIVNTKSGFTQSVQLLSIEKTLTANELDIVRYLSYYMKNYINSDEKSDRSELLPWNAPDECRTIYEF